MTKLETALMERDSAIEVGLEVTRERDEARARVTELEDAIREVREDQTHCCVMEPAALRDLFILLEAK